MRDRALWLGCLVYAALFTWLGSIKYEAHRNLVDFGIFSQTVASAFGCFCNPIEGSHWAFHFSPILYAAGIAVAVIRSPLTLIALQAIAGALVAPPIYALVRVRSDAGRARLAALVALLYPPLAGLVFGDFHENGFAPAAVAWTLYAFDAGMLVWAFVAALITLSIKEDQAVFLAIGGALGAWRFRGTKRGLLAAAVAATSVLVLAAFFAYIRPHAAAAAVASWEPGAVLCVECGGRTRDSGGDSGEVGVRAPDLCAVALLAVSIVRDVASGGAAVRSAAFAHADDVHARHALCGSLDRLCLGSVWPSPCVH